MAKTTIKKERFHKIRNNLPRYTLPLLLLSASAAVGSDDTLFRVYSHAAPQSVVTRSFAGAGSAVPHDVFQGLANPALTAPAGSGATGAYGAGYGRDHVFDKLVLPFGALFFEENGAIGAYYRYLNGKQGAVHDAVVNLAGRLFEQTDPKGNGPVEFGMNIRYENSTWRHDVPLTPPPPPPTKDNGNSEGEPAPAMAPIEARANSLIMDIGFYQRYLPGFDFSLVFSNLTGYRWSRADGRGKSEGWLDGRHRTITVGMLYSLPITNSVSLRVPIDVEAANAFVKSNSTAYMLRAGAEARIAQAYCARFGYARAPQDPAELIADFDYDNLFFGGVGVAVKGVLLDVFAGKNEFGVSAAYGY
jgi:hypothetical protein